jgi:hypothetical protein
LEAPWAFVERGDHVGEGFAPLCRLDHRSRRGDRCRSGRPVRPRV